jgi:hypothetical protein
VSTKKKKRQLLRGRAIDEQRKLDYDDDTYQNYVWQRDDDDDYYSADDDGSYWEANKDYKASNYVESSGSWGGSSVQSNETSSSGGSSWSSSSSGSSQGGSYGDDQGSEAGRSALNSKQREVLAFALSALMVILLLLFFCGSFLMSIFCPCFQKPDDRVDLVTSFSQMGDF